MTDRIPAINAHREPARIHLMDRVDDFFANAEAWKAEYAKLRELILASGLAEDFKWRKPCYTLDGANVVLIHGFKHYCAISFFKGALVKDTESVLIQPTENMDSARQLRFETVDEIVALEGTIKSYLESAIEVEKQGLKVAAKKGTEINYPIELQKKMTDDEDFRVAFEALSPGRQRGWLLHYTGSKQSKTRESRIQASKVRVVAGKGLLDCVCGLTQRKPGCDGSHKTLVEP